MEDKPVLGVALISVYREEWRLFQEVCGKGNVSARIRELVKADLDKNKIKK